MTEREWMLARNIILEEAQRGAVVLLSSHVKQDISALCTEVYQMNAGNVNAAFINTPFF